MSKQPEQARRHAPSLHNGTNGHALNGTHRAALWSGVEMPEGVIAMRVPERLMNAGTAEREQATAVGAYKFGARLRGLQVNGDHEPAAPRSDA